MMRRWPAAWLLFLITTASALRNSVSSVRARALGSGRP